MILSGFTDAKTFSLRSTEGWIRLSDEPSIMMSGGKRNATSTGSAWDIRLYKVE